MREGTGGVAAPSQCLKEGVGPTPVISDVVEFQASHAIYNINRQLQSCAAV